MGAADEADDFPGRRILPCGRPGVDRRRLRGRHAERHGHPALGQADQRVRGGNDPAARSPHPSRPLWAPLPGRRRGRRSPRPHLGVRPQEGTAVKPIVIIPTFNEIETLPTTLDRVRSVLPDIAILVVDDNSPDGTGAWAQERSEADERLHVLHRPGKGGLAAAYIAGFGWALDRDCTHVVQMDADGSHRADDLARMLERAAGADMPDLVIGSRWVPGGEWRTGRSRDSSCRVWATSTIESRSGCRTRISPPGSGSTAATPCGRSTSTRSRWSATTGRPT
ncbi:glycosyltransferase [Flaviflexus salsibiostraticola]|uniref:Glycosyltransferase n=1 Tax=Flaviflexus salsibiostraticola TaxID=1282737 RepID=A0A3S8ZC13_9ACTO|nr:glycosyltransferase [Flaviflexus salsibiostraticola]